MISDSEIHEVIKQEFLDPLPKEKDHHIWKMFLDKLLHLVDIKTYQAFRGLRACGARFELSIDSLDFKMPEEFDTEFREVIRNKYIIPNAEVIQKLIKYVYKMVKK
jgi:hypothetical protein